MNLSEILRGTFNNFKKLIFAEKLRSIMNSNATATFVLKGVTETGIYELLNSLAFKLTQVRNVMDSAEILPRILSCIQRRTLNRPMYTSDQTPNYALRGVTDIHTSSCDSKAPGNSC
ncbi:hypothetical protein ACU8KH_02334 [Lachancea thermotolerans]